MGEILQNDSDYDDLSREKDTVEESKEESMSKRIKIKLSDIDMSGLNTDAFSNKIDAFLDEKSEELIQSWSLATTKPAGIKPSRFFWMYFTLSSHSPHWQVLPRSSFTLAV